jgi:hypothetical protein
MSIEQDTPTLPQEDVLQVEIDRQAAATAHEYERRWWTLGGCASAS